MYFQDKEDILFNDLLRLVQKSSLQDKSSILIIQEKLKAKLEEYKKHCDGIDPVSINTLVRWSNTHGFPDTVTVLLLIDFGARPQEALTTVYSSSNNELIDKLKMMGATIDEGKNLVAYHNRKI